MPVQNNQLLTSCNLRADRRQLRDKGLEEGCEKGNGQEEDAWIER